MPATVVARDEFLLSVRNAVAELLPPVDAKHPYTEKKDLEGALRRFHAWLSKGSVEGYQSRDFEDLDPEARDALDRNVSEFLGIASKVGPKRPATLAQVDAALPPFLEIIPIVRKILLDDWLQSAREVIDQATAWAEAEGWPTKHYPWTMIEGFLGTYELDRLIFGVAGSQMALIPVARFMMSCRGAFDLAVMPAYESVMVKRGPSGKWTIEPLPGDNRAHRWSDSAFVEISEKLARMG